MVTLTDLQLTTLAKPFLALKEAMDSSPENKQVLQLVDKAISILDKINRGKESPMAVGGSSVTSFEVNNKTKSLFEMFHL